MSAPGHTVVDLSSPTMVGIAIAVALIALMAVLLPGSAKRMTRVPAVMLAIYIVARALLVVIEPSSEAARIVSLVGTLLLFASIGRSVVVIAFEGVIGNRLMRPMPHIFRDIIQAVVWVILLLVALRTAGVDPGSILTTSALLTAAIALSMQETLGNLVAGLAIQMQHPFDVDDWIQFDSDTKRIGRVLEINWRATKVITLDDVEVIVPNATLAKVPIINFTKPTTSSRRSIYLQAPSETPPHVVRAAILAAIGESEGVLTEPPPSVVVSNFEDGNLEYWVRFHTDRFEQRDQIDSIVRERIWYGLARAGVTLALPNRRVRMQQVTFETEAQEDQRQATRREEALNAVDFIRVLSDDQRRQLAKASRIHIYGPHESIFRQGEKSGEMFIVQSGEVSISSRGNGRGMVEVARLGPGEFFGEMALMTGEARNATVRATRPTTLISVDQNAVKVLLETSPELAANISHVIAERQAQSEAALTRTDQPPTDVEERSSQLLVRIRRFFSI